MLPGGDPEQAPAAYTRAMTMTGKRLALDAGLAALVLGLSLAMLAQGGLGAPNAGARALDGLGVALTAATALPLAARRLAPLAVYLAVSVAGLALIALRYPFDVPLGPVVAVYTLAAAAGGAARPWRRWGALLAVAAFVPAAGGVFAEQAGSWARLLPPLAVWALAWAALWLAGDRARLRREQIAELEERARRLAREAERERRLAAAEERTRIARELHDAAGHAINVILVQAGAARLLHERDPEGSRRAIATIEEVARGTIAEIDRLVRALREGEEAAEPVPADPAALDELVARHRASGLRVTTAVRGQRRALPRSVAWAAYRILQEALTNAARHGTGSADVAVRFGPDALEITVTNPVAANGPARPAGPAPGGGHGITGMRERATLLGGTLQAGADRGRFRLAARLPYAEVAAR